MSARAASSVLLLLGICGGALAGSVEDPASVTVEVGGQTITLVAPAGQAEITINREPVRRYFETAIPQQNRHLATFAPFEDVERMERGEEMQCFAIAQTIRRVEQEFLGEQDFQHLRDTFRADWQDVAAKVADHIAPEFDQASERISREFDVDIDFTAEKIVPVEVIQDEADAFATMMLIRSEISSEGETIQVELVATSTMLRVKDRLLVLYYYDDHKSQADFDSARAATIRWTDAIRAANRTP